MKKIIAFLLFLAMLFVPLITAFNEGGFRPATPTDLDPVSYDYVINCNNMPKYNIVAFNNATINCHIRGSIYVGGTLKGNQYVDDGAINGQIASDSYVFNNESQIYFRSRTNEQSLEGYYHMTASSVASTAAYWKNFITNLPNNDTYIYLEPDENGIVNINPYDYEAGGSDEAYRTIEKVYWTYATTVNMRGLAGHLIAPYATVNITWCNHCGSIIAQDIYTNGEAHINTFVPPPPSEETPTPTPEPVDITINKTLIGSIWHVRCDVMDGTTFKAGGGFWKTDVIKNPNGITSKEGHRSNKCGNADNWVIWVDNNGIPFRMDEIKSGATGGTLPTVLFRPRYNLTTEEIIHMEPTDTDLVWRWSQNFQDPMSYSEIVPGQRIYWITWNGNQRWYHSGIPYKVGAPTYTIYIDGEGYNLVANGDTITIEDLEQGIHTIVEENYPDSYISNIYVDGIALSEYSGGIEITSNTNITVENTLITPPPTSSPTPPSPPVVVTPTPTPTPIPEETETPSPTPEETESPTVTPEETETPTNTPEETVSPTPEITETPTTVPTCGFTIKKIVSNYNLMKEDAIFFFKIHGVGLQEDEYIELTVDYNTGVGTIYIEGLKPGKYTVEEVDIPVEFELVSEAQMTLYVHGFDSQFIFTNKLKEVTPTPSEIPTTSPTVTVTPSETPTAPPTVTPTVPPTTVTPSEVPSETPTTPTPPPPKPTVTTSPIPTDTPTEEPTETPTETPTEEPTPPKGKMPKHAGNPIFVFDDYDTPLGVSVTINHVGDCFD